MWVDYDQEKPHNLGSHDDDLIKLGPYSLIQLKKKAYGPLLIMEPSNTLLHEMVDGMLATFACRCQCAVNTSGVTGHGPSWKNLAEAVEQELKRSFGG